MKKFSEAFPLFKYDGELKELFEDAQVERVSAPPDMSYLKLHLFFNKLVDRELIKTMEHIIKKNMFPKRDIQVSISECFRLASKYSPEALYKAYKESIISDLTDYKAVDGRLFKKAQVCFNDDQMIIVCDDTDINRHMMPEICKRIEYIFNTRCGISCRTKCEYHPVENIISNEVDVEEYVSPVKKEIKDDKFIDVKIDVEKNDDTKSEKPSEKHESSRDKSSVNSKKHANSNPDILYGRDFPDNYIQIKDIIDDIGEVIVRGQVNDFERKHINKNDLDLFTFTITDFTDSISVKMFVKPEESDALESCVRNGSLVKLRGFTVIDGYINELTIGSVKGIKKCDAIATNLRKDEAKLKRVELHCHTKLSEMDAVSSAEDIVKRVADWGMDAIAITDHGNVQAFPDAFHTVQRMGENAPKIIYGVEGYLVDDLKDIIINPSNVHLDGDFVVFDLETTGLSVQSDKIIEIGAVKVSNGKVIDRFSSFVNPEIPISYHIEKLTGINDSMVSDSGNIDLILPDFMNFISGCALVAHNAGFDVGFISREAKRLGYEFNPTVVDTVTLSRLLLPQLNRYKLDTVAKALGVSLENHHRAVDDAECTAGIFIKLIDMLHERDINSLAEINLLGSDDPELIKKLNTYHVIILVRNETGRVNLYRIISKSHINYFNKRPRIPKSLLQRYREGLIVGSACEAGELYNAIIRGETEENLKSIVDFYDYLEIQPTGNNLFMIDDDHYDISSVEDIQDKNRFIVNLGELYNKPVCATCDVHFLDPEDEVYRRILFYGMGYEDADRQPPLYLRTTDEMLNEFTYLGYDKAFEVVVTNTRMINDMIEYVEPVRPDKCPPVIENSDGMLKEACYSKAHQQYGEQLPDIVEKRLEKELNSIISNGFAVMYIIAKQLVEKSNSDGYLVGSRGSVGSSFAAYTAGISEVNPLPPHYYCSECKYSEFDTPEVKAYAGGAGCDMPDKICPVCGKPLKKDGYDIPFETFLGFKGNKEPDIDLNFSGEYQPKAHAFTEVIFGEGHTFRAGTVGAVADKTAYGYVKKYFEEHGTSKRKCEINRLLKGCVGVKRTTGQHPGGIIVLPHGEEIYSFTPIQHPANDASTGIITTHFDYHAIDHNLLKLDILGHQGPTMVRMLQDLTGIDPVRDIPLDSRETMQLFKGTDVLGIKPEDIGGVPLGSLGIPEFGTDFAMQMLIDADPQGFSDLVRIAGLAHGTDVWIGNARDLIMSGQATIQTAICTRDDIMIYLIEKGLDQEESFKIMESVRKGKGLKPDMEAHMREHEVPEWYIESCKKIKYMFPKAHAAAYVMMSWRIAYCKIFYPLAYYAAYFSIMADGFSYELMCQGREKLEYEYKTLIKKGDSISPKEQAVMKDMRIVQEYYARGFEFLPVDLYKSKGKRFIIEDGKLRPCFASIDGLGDVAAASIEKAASNGKFISKDDLRSRAKIGKSLTELMDELGLLNDIPESNQMSIFDLMN